LVRYASSEFDSRNYSKAEEMAGRALAIQRTIDGGKTGRDAVQAILLLAESRVLRHHPASAEPLLRESLGILKAKLPTDYPPVFAAEIRLGEALTAEGKAGDAEPILRNALASAYNPPFPIPAWQVGEAESALSRCLLVLGRRQEANGLLELSRKKLLTDPRPIFRERAAAHS
jgi:tetratricopeptide (TPR) repeat protein